MGDTKWIGLVMAGGSGERFWPVSRSRRPKQLLDLAGGGTTLLGRAVAGLSRVISPSDIYIATGERLAEVIRAAPTGVPGGNVIAEPFQRNTAGCIAYAMAHLLAKYAGGDTRPDAPECLRRFSVAVVTADHAIDDEAAFGATVAAVLDAAEAKQALATIGIVPTRPETGYGYIELPEDRTPFPEYTGAIRIFPVASFREKPTAPRAREFVDSGRYLWNSGAFFWNLAVLMEQLGEVRPDFAEAIPRMAKAMQAHDAAAVVEIFAALETISIDNALMERASRVIVAEAPFAWDDIGAWPALDRLRSPDENGNVILGDSVTVDCKNCIIYNDSGEDGLARVVAALGVEDVVVVATDDAVLVAPKERAQEIKKIVEELKRRNAKQV